MPPRQLVVAKLRSTTVALAASCQEDQRKKWGLARARVSVHLIAEPSKKKVILTEWEEEYDIMKLRHDRKMIQMRGPVATAIVKVSSKVRAFLQIVFSICILHLELVEGGRGSRKS